MMKQKIKTSKFFQVKNIKKEIEPRIRTTIKNEEDNLITKETGVRETWRRYCENLLNVEAEGE